LIVVSDTSPLTNLAVVGQLDVLKNIYGRVFIPDAVAEELRAAEMEGLYPPFLDRTSWLERRAVRDRASAAQLLGKLDLGEAEAIILAIEVHADLLLVDERIGHGVAVERGIRTVGLLGTLIVAKRRRLIPAVKPLLDELVAKAGFWVGKDLYSEVLAQAGE